MALSTKEALFEIRECVEKDGQCPAGTAKQVCSGWMSGPPKSVWRSYENSRQDKAQA